MRRALPWLIAIVIIGLDRLTKMLIQSHIEFGSWVSVFPGFGLSHVHNRGIAFSLFADGGFFSRIVLHAVIFTAVIAIAWLLVRQHHRGWWVSSGFGLILGGAIGNLVDRVLYGWVIDFVHVWVRLGDKEYSWPDFNVADSAITVGACLLLIGEFSRSDSKKHDARDEDAPDSD